MQKKISYFNLPNALTLMRILLIFFLIPCFYERTSTTRIIAIVIFFIACITDYLDGYFARKWQQTTKFGQLFDPVADKMLVATTLLLMAGFNYLSKTALLPALIILCREMLVSGLREFMGAKGASLPVVHLAKFKTAFQMISIGILLIADAVPKTVELVYWGEFTLWIAAALTFVTGAQYFYKTMQHI